MTVDEIIEYMLASVPNEYDTSVGSFFYDLLYPVAEQIYRLQGDISLLEQNAFALTAVGEYLDRKVAEQGITRKQATFAKGTVRISGDVGAVIQQGAKVAANDILFAVDEETVIPNSGYADVSATCVVSGSAGNAAVGQINRFPVTLPKLTDVTNITAFTGGYDEETDSELLERYLEKVSRPNVSGSKYHYIEWAKEVSGVGEVSVIPLWNGPGTVKVVIVDSLNKPATSDLITAVSEHIEELRPIGANVTVVSATALTVNISVKLTTDSSDGIKDKISAELTEYLTGEALKKSYISYAKIGGCILAVDGVDDYSNLDESYRVDYDTAGVVMSQGTKDGTYYYINTDLTWKTDFFNKWVHSKITVNLETKKVSYEISNGTVADKISGTIAFCDTTVEKVTGIEIFSYVNNIEMGIDNIKITAKYADETDDRTIYIIPEGSAFAEYIYIDGKPVCLGKSDIVSTVNSLLKRVDALENK